MWFPLAALLSLASASELADAVASGDCATLLQRTSANPELSVEWALPRGRCLLQRGDSAGAIAALSPKVEGVIGEYSRLLLARARLAQGDETGAIAALDGLKLPGEAGRELQLTRARLALRQQDATAFQAATQGIDGSEIWLLTADLAWTRGDREAAIAGYKRVWERADPGGWDAQAATKLAEAGITPSEADQRARMVQLEKRGRITEAAAIADAIGAASGERFARLYAKARQHEKALANWEKSLGKPAGSKGDPDDLFEYALSHARLGDYTTAAVVYRRLIAQHPTSSQAVFAHYKLGYMAYDAGDCPTAQTLLEEHAQRYPKSKYLDEALWFSARCHWRSGERAPAVSAWAALIAQRPDSSLVPGAVYWTARAKGADGDAAAETKGLERVLSSWPTSGYAWFAAARLGKRFEAHPAATPPPWPAELASRREVQRSQALMALGLREWARAELLPIRDALQTREARLAGAWAFIAAGDYRTGQKLASKHCVSPWKSGDPVAQQACTPRPEAGIVAATAARYGLDPLLPYGIMTAESGLDPSVTSPAGARGLMQLMPVEGPRIHAAIYADRPYDPDDIYSAPYNASMGTAELGLKKQSLGHVLAITDLPAVVASYNGGEEAVRRWLSVSDTPLEFDEFAEDIGYTETRLYVKRVLGFEMAYRWVYGDQGP